MAFSTHTPNLQIIDSFLTGSNAADTLTADISGYYFIEDKRCDANRHRKNLLSNNNIPVIPGCKTERRKFYTVKLNIS